MVSLKRRYQHSLTRNAHESAAHCSSCGARVRSWPWMISLQISRSVVSHERSQCPLPPRHDRSFNDRKGSFPSGRFSRGFPPHTPHEVAAGRAAHVSGACTGSSDDCDASPPRSACAQPLRAGPRFQNNVRAIRNALRDCVTFQVGFTDSTSCIRKMLVCRGSCYLGFVPLRFVARLRAGQN